MNHFATTRRPIDDLLEDLVAELQVPKSRYEQAERSYQSLGEWLHRPNSSLRDGDPEVYVQGSFSLGTAKKPASEADSYDVDMVCRVDYAKTRLTQADLKRLLGIEVKAYAQAHGMEAPQEGRRCWTLNYAESAQFHMDVLPALPDPEGRRSLAERHPQLSEVAATALAITDRNHPFFREMSTDWPRSNPKGYVRWFRGRMGRPFLEMARREAATAMASVEDIPTYRVQTPLQGAIQILKHHRDLVCDDLGDDKPISILITTLAAHAYGEQRTLSEALFAILSGMDRFIEDRNGVAWVANPSNPDENFADKWADYPQRRQAFEEWLERARSDFSAAAAASTRESAGRVLAEALGDNLIDRAVARRNPLRKFVPAPLVEAARLILTPAHMRKPRWPHAPEGSVRIVRATASQNGFRPVDFDSDADPLPKHCGLRFEAETSVPRPYRVYWQVVNTGAEAVAANGLRGSFLHDDATRGGLSHSESTLYSGKHTIECFIVKNGRLAARSGQFVVRIA